MKHATFPAILGLLLSLSLVACQPPAADAYRERGEVPPGPDAPAAPHPSPDTSMTIWASSQEDERILYGNPGGQPMLAITCLRGDGPSLIRITRFVPADARAKALMAIVGNGHTTRLPVEATRPNRTWLWQGEYLASEPQLDVLSGPDEIELTIPGAGLLKIKPHPLPQGFIAQCRPQVLPTPELGPEAASILEPEAATTPEPEPAATPEPEPAATPESDLQPDQ